MTDTLNTNAILQRVYDNIFAKNIAVYRDAGKKAMREIRKSIVNEWFGEFDHISMNAATTYYVTAMKVDDMHVRLTLRSWVDPQKYNFYQNIQEWKVKRKIWSSSLYAVKYVLNLQLEEGIIGLPKRGSQPIPWENRRWVDDDALDNNGYWINRHFHQRPVGLRETIENSSKWTNGELLETFYKFARKGVK